MKLIYLCLINFMQAILIEMEFKSDKWDFDADQILQFK